MKKYIDAEKLCDAIDSLDTVQDVPNAVFIYDAIQTIYDAPPADVQEVSHGKWFRTVPTTPKSYRRICSCCRQVAYMVNAVYRYCPNCGAYMKGD